MSRNNKLAPFRECYSRLHELRALASSVPVIALTATATRSTRETIFEVLMLRQPVVIYESVNKKNIIYSVKYINKENDLDHYFGWVYDEIVEKKELCDRTIIYCQTIKQSSMIYATIKGMLGHHMYGDSNDLKSAYVEMLHSCTPESNKENILTSFSQENGLVRVLVATIAFAMGVDCKAVKRVIHFGLSKNIESYTQESGRAGRDGSLSTVFLLYNGLMLANVEADIKSYVMNEQCRRKAILMHFDEPSPSIPTLLHECCDFCAQACKCGLIDCANLTTYPTSETINKQSKGRSREVTELQKKNIENKLTIYYKNLLKKLITTSSTKEVKTLTCVPFLIGFSDVHVQQVVDNVEYLFTIKDICELVEIWDLQHAYKILSILIEEFGDTELQAVNDFPEFEFDDEFLEEWEELIKDDELLLQVVDNLSVSQLGDSCVEQMNISETGVPTTVLETLENVQIG